METVKPRKTQEGLYLQIYIIIGVNILFLESNLLSMNGLYLHTTPSNPQGQTLIIEWGTIDLKTKEAKLHNYLYQVIDYPDRVKQGMQLSSGHLARTESGIWLALLDKVSHEPNYRLPILKEGPVGQMINTLWAHGFVPLTTEGYVQLPVFR